MLSSLQQVPRRASLVTQTVAFVRVEISARRWQRWLPGEHELCEQLHVSRRTLRAALKQLQREGWLKVSQGRRREIIQKRAARSRVVNNVVLLTPKPLQSLPSSVVCWIDGLREQLSDASYHLQVHVSRSVYGSLNEHAVKMLTQTVRPAAWVLYQSTYQMQRRFSLAALPCVITGTRHQGIELPSVDLDYRAACRHAAGQFLARGHRRVVLINPESGTGGEQQSEQGFHEAFKQLPASDVQASVVRHDGTVAGICGRLDTLFHKSAPPTALLVSRPVHVLTVIGYLLRRGIKVPQQVGVISRDDESFLEHVVPSVARYASLPSAFAQKLSAMVLEIADGGVLAAVDHRIMPDFVKGESFG